MKKTSNKAISKSKISRIVVTGLFEKYNYDINTKEWLTILIAPNGYGKTTIFNMLNLVFNYSWQFLSLYSFETFRIEFGNEQFIKINKKDNTIFLTTNSILTDTVVSNSEIIERNKMARLFISGEFSADDSTTKKTEFVYLNDLDKISLMYEYIENKEFINTNPYILHRFLNELLLFKNKNKNNLKNMLNKLNSKKQLEILHSYYSLQLEKDYNVKLIISLLPKVFNSFNKNPFDDRLTFIKTNRIYKSNLSVSFSNFSDSINEIEISSIDFINYLNNLILNTNKNDFTKTLTVELSHKLNSVAYFLVNCKETKKAANILYDYLKKGYFPGKLTASILKLNKFLLFKNIMNNVFKLKNNFTLNKHFIGFDNLIPLKKLSSGEKNLLLLFFKILVEAKWRSLILIDEPEISLHLSWQTKFLSTLEIIKKVTQQNFIIATHSPDLIHDKYKYLYDMVNKNDKQ
jgi:predicted ATPase